MATRSSLSTGGTRERFEERDFVAGFERDESVLGRPVDIAEGPDGAIYISDDFMGGIWRVTRGERPATPRIAANNINTKRASPSMSPASDPQQISRGQALYEASACAGCHEPGLASKEGGMHPLENLAQRYSVKELAGLLKTPPANMPRFPFTPSQREDLAAYLLQMHASPSHP